VLSHHFEQLFCNALVETNALQIIKPQPHHEYKLFGSWLLLGCIMVFALFGFEKVGFACWACIY
jgi:hypothetical protein